MAQTPLKGTYVPGPVSQQTLQTHNFPIKNDKIRPQPDYSMPLATVAFTAAQTAAFLLLQENVNISDSGISLSKIGYVPDQPDGYSPLGTPVYGRIILGKTGAGESNTYTDAQGKTGSYQTVELDCALVNAVDFNRKVVVTNIQGLDDPIIEFISNGGNDISISGIFNSTPGVAPFDFIFNLSSIFNATVPIPITNYYLNLLNIFYIVIMPGTTMGQLEGGYATQMFTIKALSVTPMTEMLP